MWCSFKEEKQKKWAALMNNRNTTSTSTVSRVAPVWLTEAERRITAAFMWRTRQEKESDMRCCRVLRCKTVNRAAWSKRLGAAEISSSTPWRCDGSRPEPDTQRRQGLWFWICSGSEKDRCNGSDNEQWIWPPTFKCHNFITLNVF